MREVPTDYKLARGENLPQKGEERRRIALESCDLSQIDFTAPEMRRLIKAAYRELLKYRIRPTQKVEEV